MQGMRSSKNLRNKTELTCTRHFGWILGSPPGVPGGGITGVLPPPLGGTEMPGSTPAGGQITPLDWESWSLNVRLPVVSFEAPLFLLVLGGHEFEG